MKSKLFRYRAMLVILAMAVIAWLAVVSFEEMSLFVKGFSFIVFLGIAVGLYYLLTRVFKTLRALHRDGKLGTFLALAIPVFFVATIAGAYFFAGRGGRDEMLIGDIVAGATFGIMAVGAVASWMK
jgi:hypothetical protein